MANINRTESIILNNFNSIQSLPINTTILNQQIILINYDDLPLVERLTIHITLIVSVIGIIGNLGTIIILNQHTMRQWRSSMLLSALGIVDFLYLFIIFLSIIDRLTHQAIGLHRSLILCQTTVYITHVCSFLSAGFTLSFTLQRFVAVLFPLHANVIISHRSSIINILILIIFSSIFYLFSFIVTNISQGQCREDETYRILYPLLIVDICLTFLIPFICIVLFNCAIVYKLQTRDELAGKFEGTTTSTNSGRLSNDCYQERQRLHSLTNPIRLHTDNLQNSNTNKINIQRNSTNFIDYLRPRDEYHKRLSHHRLSTPSISNEYMTTGGHTSNHHQTVSQRTTKMLVICSTTFLIFNSPYSAVLFYSILSKHVLTRTLDILRYFYFMSFCLNFFLYSLCGNRFRHELINISKKFYRKLSLQNIRHYRSNSTKLSNRSNTTRTEV